MGFLETGSFGYWLKRRRKALDLTQTELARRARCATATIRKIEADERKPSPELAGLLANALEISPQERSTFFQAVHDVRAVERLMQGDFAQIVRSAPNNLPAPLTSFINRVQDNAAVVALLTREDVRLLTLTGLPGIGKTRLGIHAAENLLEHFPDGVWFVELAAVTEPALVLPAIMRVLEIAESGPQIPLRQLTSALQDKRVLLVLDNFEQVLDAAAEVAELLRACRGLKVLVTSRVPLHLYGEHAYVLPPMSLPEREQTPSQLVQAESAQLFLARVKEHQPRFAITAANAPLIAEVCVRLEGVPLALELAAASLRRMTLEQLVRALSGEPHWLSALRTAARDLPPRQQTLYNALAWSYGLLDTGTQQVFRPLGVLRGGFDLSAASAVCGLDEHLVGNALAELTDQHLLAHDGTR
ncbi:ATP-binding protein [Meiothermus ruber]|uniref:ATP-binding protein n=1 Tax=Meiothermus ruber TaxID=277 RepID=UPI00019E8782|nr:helix-turn-helix domain-containing protein [Meiothermus ruber]GAO73816.1 Transcriptional regulator, XRE family [Meiothermus ruber H328]